MKLIDVLDNQLRGKRIFVYRYKLKFNPTLPDPSTVVHYYISKDNHDTYQLPKWEVLDVEKVEVTIDNVDGYYEEYEGNHLHIQFNSLEEKELKYHMYVKVTEEIEVIE